MELSPRHAMKKWPTRLTGLCAFTRARDDRPEPRGAFGAANIGRGIVFFALLAQKMVDRRNSQVWFCADRRNARWSAHRQTGGAGRTFLDRRQALSIGLTKALVRRSTALVTTGQRSAPFRGGLRSASRRAFLGQRTSVDGDVLREGNPASEKSAVRAVPATRLHDRPPLHEETGPKRSLRGAVPAAGIEQRNEVAAGELNFW